MHVLPSLNLCGRGVVQHFQGYLVARPVCATADGIKLPAEQKFFSPETFTQGAHADWTKTGLFIHIPS